MRRWHWRLPRRVAARLPRPPRAAFPATCGKRYPSRWLLGNSYSTGVADTIAAALLLYLLLVFVVVALVVLALGLIIRFFVRRAQLRRTQLLAPANGQP